MTDYSKVCWNCGNANMEDKGSHAQCKQCGATWNYVGTLGADPKAGKSTDQDYLRTMKKLR